MPLTTRAYAKINIGLAVVARREDGYHTVRTLFHRVDLHDEIRLEPAARIEVVSSSPDAPGDRTNLCHRAARALSGHLGTSDGVRIHLRKQIPVGAGLGGGSSDAAAVLRALPVFWNRPVEHQTLATIALGIGSDVPYFLQVGSALAGGRGEELEYFALDLPFAILLCHPRIPVSTAWAYTQVHPSGEPPPLLASLNRGLADPSLLRTQLRNDFEEPVFRQYPEIRDVKLSMLETGAVYSSLSGSGSAVFGFYADSAAAEAGASELRSRGYDTWITPPHFQPPVLRER